MIRKSKLALIAFIGLFVPTRAENVSQISTRSKLLSRDVRIVFTMWKMFYFIQRICSLQLKYCKMYVQQLKWKIKIYDFEIKCPAKKLLKWNRLTILKVLFASWDHKKCFNLRPKRFWYFYILSKVDKNPQECCELLKTKKKTFLHLV